MITKLELENLYITQGLSLNDIAKIYHCSSSWIRSLCIKFSIPRRSVKASCSGTYNKKLNQAFDHTRKYNVDQNFFKTWSSDMAYILGIIASDGCIENNNKCSITQKDCEILNKINVIINNQRPLKILQNHKTNKQYYKLQIYSTVLVNDLINLGITQRKSLTLQFPIIPKKYLWHFIRGIFDGDGSIHLHKKTYPVISFIGSCDFINVLNIKICKSIKTELKKIDTYNKKYPKLSFWSRQDILDIKRRLYKGINENNYYSIKKQKFDLWVK